jgi:uncharacterized membrane protein
MYHIARLGYLYVFSLLVGFMAVVQWSLVPAQNRLNSQGYATLEQGMNSVLKTLTPILMIASILLGLLVIVLAYRRTSSTRLLYVAAVACGVSMVVSTLMINAPINDAVDAWNAAAPPMDWAALRDRWEFGHAIRSYVGLVGLAFAHAASIWDSPQGSRD